MATISVKSDHGMKFPKMYFGKDEKTFQYDSTRPPLPVPTLQQTLRKYLDSVTPLVSEEDLKITTELVEEFARGQGKELHAKLLDKARDSPNWLEKWWDTYAYLSFREPHNPYVNFSGPAPLVYKLWPAKEGTQIKRASMLMWSTLKYWQMLYKEMMVVDRGGMKEKNIWSMSQFRRMFNSCKIPGEKIDSFRFHFKTEREGPPLTNMLVFCRGRMFYFDGADGEGEPLTVPELEKQLTRIYQRCENEAEGPGLGCLTGHNRTEFYKARQHLLSIHKDHEKNLDIIEKALIAISLDEHSPSSVSEICQGGLLGDCKNRWTDKSMTYIVFKNGVIGSNCDHAPHDAMVMVSGTLFNQLVVEMNDNKWKGPLTVRAMPEPEELVFRLDSRMYMYLEDAVKVYQRAVDSIEILADFYTEYGRKLLRQLKVHPDTHCQIAGQYAYYRLYGRPAATYETASTRKFYNARTETLRSCTKEAVDFSTAMMSDSATKEERLRCLKVAYDKHNQMMVDCQNAMGCDRHLFGLQMIASEAGIETPQIFTDPSWTKSGGGGHFTMSTSFVGYTDVFGGVAPMCKDGYGYFYAIQPDRISFWISSWTGDVSTNARMLFDSVCVCLTEMRELLEYEANAKQLTAKI